MDSKKTERDNPNPRAKANFLSVLLHLWLRPLFFRKSPQDLEVKDLYNNLPWNASEPLGNELEIYWNDELKNAKEQKRKAKFFNAIRKAYFWNFMQYAPAIFIEYTVLRLVQPYILGRLIWHFDVRATSTASEAYTYAFLIVLLAFLIAVIEHNAIVGLIYIGGRVRVAACSLMYRKMLRLSSSSSNKTTQGQIVNLMSNDVARFERVFLFMHDIWIMPFQTCVLTYMIYRSVGVASFAGVLLLTIQSVFIQGYLGKLISKLRLKIAVRCDERIRVMSEIIKCVKVIKMYTWEKPFENLVARARNYEVQVLTWMSYIKGFNFASYSFTERTTLYLTILAYVLQGNDISADVAFSMAQYFNILQLTMVIYFPLAISTGAESLVSMRRIEDFLLLDEKKTKVKSKMNGQVEEKNDVDISIQKVNASWCEETIVNTLCNINIIIPRGKLLAVVGAVASGKSSLLKLILDEIPILCGEICVNGSIAYVSQESWLFRGTLRQNVLFGQAYDESKYMKVVRACALDKDFLQLPQGDKTFVGDKGASLSGGQRARVNLARAVYRDENIYLLDDPLSAVDSHVGKHLFNKCIKEYLGSKTRILVTHQIQYAKYADIVVLLSNGKIEKMGSYEEIQKESIDFLRRNSVSESPEKTSSPRKKSVSVHDFQENFKIVSESNNEEEGEPQETEELIAKGSMSKQLFYKYICAGASSGKLVFVAVLIVLAMLCANGTDYWLGYWIRQGESRTRTHKKALEETNRSDFSIFNTTLVPQATNESIIIEKGAKNVTDQTNFLSNETALLIYGILVLSQIITSLAKNVMFYRICMNASRNLHNSMFSSLLKAPMSFFDLNPAGRILNRFSKDVGTIDELLPDTLVDSIQILSVMVGIMAQVIIINWMLVFPAILLCYVFWKMRKIFMSTAQSLWRLEAATKSPVLSHVNASLSGLTTIRSLRAENMLSKEFDAHQDLHSRAFFLSASSNQAFGFWLDMSSISFVAFATFSFIILDNGGTFSGDVGLALSQVSILCGTLQWGIRQMSETFAKMTSVERIVETCEKLEVEGPFESSPNEKPAKEWPLEGQIKFENVSLRYSESDPPVLKNLNISIQPGMKVGIVGRTGAGKSSLISALFRLSKVEGTIYIDKVDSSKIGLHDLRRSISIIPQDPMLFCTTLRDNLDPFGEFEDAALWSALEIVELKNSVPGLDYAVAQEGGNLSAGQRQLICLARAIIRRNKVIVMDEATANVDPKTDQLIQRTIKVHFDDCTVLTIAHRLNTIMDSDKVLVMDQGQVVEFEHPHLLLQKNDGFFTRLVQETGNSTAHQLKEISKMAYEKYSSGENVIRKDSIKEEVQQRD